MPSRGEHHFGIDRWLRKRFFALPTSLDHRLLDLALLLLEHRRGTQRLAQLTLDAVARAAAKP